MSKQRTTKKQREEQQAKQREEARLKKERDHAFRPLFGTGGSGRKTPNRLPTLETPVYAKDSKHVPSLITAKPFNNQVPVQYDEEMSVREAAAQVEIAQKRKRVAVVCHKSGYQYVGEAEDPKTFGKKSQALE
ncbi:hypothetical protein Peetri_00075 [Pseudomonas phage vB_PpuM-Peetri]